MEYREKYVIKIYRDRDFISILCINMNTNVVSTFWDRNMKCVYGSAFAYWCLLGDARVVQIHTLTREHTCRGRVGLGWGWSERRRGEERWTFPMVGHTAGELECWSWPGEDRDAYKGCGGSRPSISAWWHELATPPRSLFLGFHPFKQPSDYSLSFHVLLPKGNTMLLSKHEPTW